jgi:hypothetical protein
MSPMGLWGGVEGGLSEESDAFVELHAVDCGECEWRPSKRDSLTPNIAEEG